MSSEFFYIRSSSLHNKPLLPFPRHIPRLIYRFHKPGISPRCQPFHKRFLLPNHPAYSFLYSGASCATTEALEITLILHEEGRYRPNGSDMIYEYNLTDHLGNTRITFGDADADGAPDILQENHYYPFGMAMTMSSTPTAAPPNDYLYNGKELQTELGLDWYDYGARMYDASIGRWNGVEALAEKYVAWSPFNYTLSNPIRFVDPDGNSAVDWKDNGDGTYTAEKGDGAYTLARDAGITLAEAKKSIEESGFELYLDVDGIEKVGIDPGAVVTVENFNSEEEYQPEDESDVQGYPSFDEWQRENRTENDILVAGMEGAGTGVAAYVLGNWGRGLKLPKLNGGEVAAGFVIGSWLEMGSQLREWSESLTPDQREARESNRARAIEMIIEYKGDYGE